MKNIKTVDISETILVLARRHIVGQAIGRGPSMLGIVTKAIIQGRKEHLTHIRDRIKDQIKDKTQEDLK